MQTIIPQWQQRSNRAIVRLLQPRIIREYNKRILERALQMRPEILLAFKGSFVESRTLEILRQSQIALYNYYPDTSPSAHDPILAESIGNYDCVFYTKKFWSLSLPEVLAGRRTVFLPHGYDPDAPPSLA